MRIQSLLRKVLPASIVALVLAFSYFAPALGLVAPTVSTGVGVNCGRFGYGYHGGKHLFTCPNSPQPAPAIQPLGGAPPPTLKPKPGAAPAPILPTGQPPAAPALPPVFHHVVAPTPAPQNLGPLSQTGALARLAAGAAEFPFVVIALIVIALASFGAAIALRLRRRRQA